MVAIIGGEPRRFRPLIDLYRETEALGGISRISFQMNVASLPQAKMMRAIDAIGARVAPRYIKRTRLERRESSSRAASDSREWALWTGQ
jgi:hypothetical protein